MTNAHVDSIDEFTHQLLALEPLGVPILTATIDLGAGADGRPTALRMLRQGVREAIARYSDDPSGADLQSLEDDAETLHAIVEEAAGRGSAGLLYIGAAGTGLLRTLETAYPLRNAIDIDDHPCLFELVRWRYLVGTAVVLASISLREVEISRVRYGFTVAADSIEPHQRLDKLKQRTKREGFGAPGGAGGHSMSRVQQYVDAQRAVFAEDAAGRIAGEVQPGDLLILAGADESRAAVRRQLPESLQATAINSPALDPTQDERSRSVWLTQMAVDAHYDLGDQAAAQWFEDEWSEQTVGGIEAVQLLASQGRLGRLLLHEDAVDHFGGASDVRDRRPHHDPRRVEALLRSALGQDAEVLITRHARALEQYEGVLGVARF